MNILVIGCGSGWLCAQLANATRDMVTGIDIYPNAIDQARRIFGHISNLEFIPGDLLADILPDRTFELIIFEASIQYFPSFKKIIGASLQHLTLQGQIRIVDSLFYPTNKITDASEKTKDYYQKIGVPGMANYHFHHSLDELRHFQFKILYDPYSWINKLGNNPSPFHHILIKNRYQ